MIPETNPLQAHFSLDSHPPFRLMSHWTRLSISLARVERLARTVRAESLAPTVKQMLKRGDEPEPIHI